MTSTHKPIKLWAFYHNPMVYESSAYIVSYHRTKKGATLAMRKHKAEARKEFDEMYKDNNWAIFVLGRLSHGLLRN